MHRALYKEFNDASRKLYVITQNTLKSMNAESLCMANLVSHETHLTGKLDRVLEEPSVASLFVIVPVPTSVGH